MSKGFLSGLAWGAVAFTLAFGLIALFGPRPDVPMPDAEPPRADAPVFRLSDDIVIAPPSDPDTNSAADTGFSLQGILPPDPEPDSADLPGQGIAENDAVLPPSDAPAAEAALPMDVTDAPAAEDMAADDAGSEVDAPDAVAVLSDTAPELPLIRLGDATPAPSGAAAPVLGAARDVAPPATPRPIVQPHLPGAFPPALDTAAPAALPPAPEADVMAYSPPMDDTLTGLRAAPPEAAADAETTIATIGLPGEAIPEPTMPDVTTPDEATPEEATASAAAETGAPDAAAAPTAEQTPTAALPRTGLTSFEGVRTNRLPTVNGRPDPAPSPSAPEPAPEDVADIDAFDMALPAYLRFAQPYENPRFLPIMAIVLVDDGISPVTRELIADLPFAVTVAIDPTLADAGTIAATYRAAGKEVVALASALPARAAASDVDVTFASHFAAVPHAVAVMDVAGAGFQGNRAVSQLVVPVLAADGHGLITYNRGLNAAAQVAQAAGIAQTQVFRDLDEDAPNPFLLRRYLDRAVFEAMRDGQVVVTGRASHAPTLEAILSWRMEGRASDVALVPVSATLRNE